MKTLIAILALSTITSAALAQEKEVRLPQDTVTTKMRCYDRALDSDAKAHVRVCEVQK